MNSLDGEVIDYSPNSYGGYVKSSGHWNQTKKFISRLS